MATLRQPRRNTGAVASEEFRSEARPNQAQPGELLQMQQPDNLFQRPASPIQEPPPLGPPPINYPDPGGGGGGGTSQGPREGSVGSGERGGAGVRSITTPRVPTPFSGAQVGLVPPAATPTPSLRSLTTSNMPAPFSTPRNVDIFGGSGRGSGPLFGMAGGLQGGGLGVPGASTGAGDPSALIQALLKILGGR